MSTMTNMAATSTDFDQGKWVKEFYDGRASKYDDSWHPRFAQELLDRAQPRQGYHILDLACGTGLVNLPAVKAVAPSGKVVGIDLSHLMLEENRRKIQDLPEEEQIIATIIEHDISDLTTIPELQGTENSFDIITCCSALVLLETPKEVVAGWTKYLKPQSGRLVVDVTHPRNQRNGMVIEIAMRKLGMKAPTHRAWCQSGEDLGAMLVGAGLRVEQIEFLEQVGFKQRFHDSSVTAATSSFEEALGFLKWTSLEENDPATYSKLKEAFIKEWQASANENGQVEEVDGSFVAVARRP